MTIKKLICTFIILCTSSSAFASLIRVDFSAEFASTPPTLTIDGWFQYDDTTNLLTDISLEILGVVHSTSTVGFDLDFWGPDGFLLGGLEGSFDSVNSTDVGDFFLYFTADFPQNPQSTHMVYADGNNNKASSSVILNYSTIGVPEPATIGIFALGLVGLAARRFKKQS